MLLRVAVGIHHEDMEKVKKTYDLAMRVGLPTQPPPCLIPNAETLDVELLFAYYARRFT